MGGVTSVKVPAGWQNAQSFCNLSTPNQGHKDPYGNMTIMIAGALVLGLMLLIIKKKRKSANNRYK